MIKELIVLLLVATFVAPQVDSLMTDFDLTPPPTISPPLYSTAPLTASTVQFLSASAAPSSTPSSSTPLDTASTDKILSSASPTLLKAGTTTTSLMASSSSSAYSDATNAWNYLKKIGGGCCNNCKVLCGFAIKLSGTNYYLTNKNSYLSFENVSGATLPLRIFNFTQNADCTWAISVGNKYLSTAVYFSGQWVSLSNTIGVNQRWYIERNGNYVTFQSASIAHYYWRVSASPSYFLGYSYYQTSRFTIEYFPCDLKAGWN